jgi:hypothetical protein
MSVLQRMTSGLAIVSLLCRFPCFFLPKGGLRVFHMMTSALLHPIAAAIGLMMVMLATRATGEVLAQGRSPAEGPWSGQAQCVVVAQLPDYQDEQTHTWRLTGEPPMPAPRGSAQVFYTWPATWSVQGRGRKTWPSPTPGAIGREQSERWTIAHEMSSPLRITELGTGRLRIGAEGQRGASLGAIRVTEVSGRTREGSVQQWQFPVIEDNLTNTTISGTSTRTYPEGFGVGWGQPPKAITTTTCTWSFTRGAIEQSSGNQPARGRGARPTGAFAGTSEPVVSVTTASLPPAQTSGSSAATLPATGVTLGTNLTAAVPGGPPVGGLRVQTTSPTQVALHWNCVQGSTGYEVFFAMNGGQSVKITPTPLNPNCVQDLAQVNPAFLAPGSTPVTTYSTGFSQGGLTPANDYTYVVRALYATGGPADSPPVTVRPLVPAPAAPPPTKPGCDEACQKAVQEALQKAADELKRIKNAVGDLGR